VGKPFWFQLYMIRDRAFMADLLERAKSAKCSALVFTVDMPVPGTRYRDVRSGLAGASGCRARPGGCPRPCCGRAGRSMSGCWGGRMFWAMSRRCCAARPGWRILRLDAGEFDPSVTWKDLEWVRRNWSGPLILKGYSIRMTPGRRPISARMESSSPIMADGSWMA